MSSKLLAAQCNVALPECIHLYSVRASAASKEFLGAHSRYSKVEAQRVSNDFQGRQQSFEVVQRLAHACNKSSKSHTCIADISALIV